MSTLFKDIYHSVTDNEFEFLIEFLFQLTILGREAHSALSGDELRNATIQLNEINHRVLNRIKDLKSFSPWSDKQYLLDMVASHVEQAPILDQGVGYAAELAYERIFVHHDSAQ